MAVEERRPVPSFPGRIRLAAVRDKEKIEGKQCRQTSRLNTLAAPRHRPDRAFGTARSSNVNLQKPTAVINKNLKQAKPILVSKKPPVKDDSKIGLKTQSAGVSGESAEAAKGNPKLDARKPAVRFLDQAPPIGKNFRKIPILADGPLTPKSLIRPAKSGTPYFSAKSCSNCRFDKLEYAPYWLSQIKLAESVEKHFASAAFFRLAFECNAEPIRSLKSELKRYMARHSSLADIDLWKEISCKYGLSDGEQNPGLINFDSLIPSGEGNLKNSDPVSLDEKSITPEESLHSIMKENRDADDASDESRKVTVDCGDACVESCDYGEDLCDTFSPGEIQCEKSGDYGISPHQDQMKEEAADDVNSDDSSGQKKSGSCIDNSPNEGSKDITTSDGAIISSIIEEEIIKSSSAYDKSDYGEDPCEKLSPEDIQCGKSGDYGITSHQDPSKEAADDVNSDDSSGHKKYGSCNANSPNEGSKDITTSDAAIISSILEEEIIESSSEYDKSKSMGESDGKGVHNVKDEINKNQNARPRKKVDAKKKNLKATNGTRSTAFLVTMR